MVWRRFRVDPQCTLPLLHLILQSVMGWENSHLHSFESGGKRFGLPSEETGDLWIDERRYRLRSLARGIGDEFSYTYDFGDRWKHRIVVERALERSRSVVHPKCIDGANACPPEDCGGPPGYQRVKMILENPKLSEHASVRRWIGERFDPNRFELTYQNLNMFGFRGTSLPWWAR